MQLRGHCVICEIPSAAVNRTFHQRNDGTFLFRVSHDFRHATEYTCTSVSHLLRHGRNFCVERSSSFRMLQLVFLLFPDISQAELYIGAPLYANRRAHQYLFLVVFSGCVFFTNPRGPCVSAFEKVVKVG